MMKFFKVLGLSLLISLLATSNLQAATDLLVASDATDEDPTRTVKRCNGETGDCEDFIGPQDWWFTGMTFGPDGNIYVTVHPADEVRRFDGATGDLIDTFVTSGLGSLDGPRGLVFRQEGGNWYLYVVSKHNSKVLKYDATGGFIKEFINTANSGGLNGPSGAVFADGKMYVTSTDSDEVFRYDGTTGDFIDVFVSASSGGLNAPWYLDFGPDGHLYVCSYDNDQVLKYDGTTGAFLSVAVPSSCGLDRPIDLKFGPDDGLLYVASQFTDEIIRSDGITCEVFTDVPAPLAMVFFPEPTPVEMPCFKVNKMQVMDHKKKIKPDKIKIMGTFNIDFGPGSDPFDPPPAVSVKIDEDEFTVPGELFVEQEPLGSNYFAFKGDVTDVGKVKIFLNFDECSWKINIKGKDASPLWESDGTTVKLTIGIYEGEETFTWTKKKRRCPLYPDYRLVRFKADPQVNCCDSTCGDTSDYTWHEYNGHQYALTLNTGNWEEAEAEAVSLCGHLVTINDADESEWLGTTFGAILVDVPLWMGFYQDLSDPSCAPNCEPDGGWKWISGQPVTYTNWPSHEPNNQSVEDYAYFSSSATSGTIPWAWNDWGPTSINFYPIYGVIELE